MIKKILNKDIYGAFLFVFLISSINSPPSIPSEFNILNLLIFLEEYLHYLSLFFYYFCF